MNLLTSEQLNRLKSLLITLPENELIWVSGYVSGLIHSKSVIHISEDTSNIIKKTEVIPLDKKIIIISASQTGNARRISEKLYNDYITSGLDAVLFNAGNYKFKNISEVRLLILITSTHGSGEPPEEAIALYKYLFSKKAPRLNNTNFAVLSLGDRSYEHFAKAGKDFDKRFEELGAHRLYHRLDVDVDFEYAVNTWRKEIVSVFRSKISSISIVNQNSNTQDIILKNDKHVTYCKEFPFIACLSNRQKITSSQSIKDVHHLEIDITGSNLFYQPGDSLGVWYENDPNLISELLNILNFTGHELVKIRGKSIPLHEALQKYYELTQNNLIVVKNIATISQNKLLLDLLDNPKQLKSFISTTPIIDMLYQVSIKLTSQELLQILRPIQPRFYSISSAQSEVGEEIHITVSAVRYKINGRLRSGGSSSYLIDRLQEDDKLRIFVQTNDNFRLPKNFNTPIIMIGAGTGVAPFRSFIQQRASDKAIGKNWLFFGNLRFIDDFLYQTEWQFYVKEGILNKIDTAWSRDQVDKIYVQDKLLKNSIEIWDWIQNGAYIYVCGDAKHMAYGVEQALILLVSENGNMNIEQATDFWNDMRSQHRYQRDIY